MKNIKFPKPELIIKFLLVFMLALMPVLVLAQEASQAPTAAKSCEDFKNKFNVTINGKTTNLASGEPFYCTASDLILTIINYLLAISGTITILFLMVGGFWYLTSAGSEEQAEKGKKTLINSIIGLVVIILAYSIVRIVSSTLSLGK